MLQGKYYISVGEPWDFEGPDGPNIIRGRIEKIISDDCIIFKSDHEIAFGDVKGDIFALFPQHQGHDFFDLAHHSVTVGGGLLLVSSYDHLSAKDLQRPGISKYVIIGSLYNASWIIPKRK